MIKANKVTKKDTNDSLDSLTMPQVLSNPLGMPSHSLGLYTHSIPQQRNTYSSNFYWNLAYQTLI